MCNISIHEKPKTRTISSVPVALLVFLFKENGDVKISYYLLVCYFKTIGRPRELLVIQGEPAFFKSLKIAEKVLHFQVFDEKNLEARIKCTYTDSYTIFYRHTKINLRKTLRTKLYLIEL